MDSFIVGNLHLQLIGIWRKKFCLLGKSKYIAKMSLRAVARKSVGIINPCIRQLHVSKLMKDTFTNTDAVLAKPQQTKLLGEITIFISKTTP